MTTSTHNIPFGRPIIGEAEHKAVQETLSSPQLVHGPRARQFESDFASYTGCENPGVSLGSCTAGLHLAYVHFGIGPGDEVIVPSLSHVATAHSVEYTGATPIFVDVLPETGNIDPEQVEAAITERTKAIAVVHYLGLPADMDPIMALARKHNLYVIEDSALSVGGYYKGTHTGLIGDIGSFSFYPVKHMTTAEGGMIISKHAEVCEKINKLKAFGYDKQLGERATPGVYDVNMLGYNYRMNEIEAAIGVEQLKRIPGFVADRARNADALRTAFQNIDEIRLLADGDEDHTHANYCLVAVLKDKLSTKRPQLMNALKERGIGTSVYYPGPIPHLTYYKEKYALGGKTYPHANQISNHSIALPVGPHLSVDEMAIIGQEMKSAISRII
ncbi:DegT/DnrJ/EryC1/StrS family aminotransferase [Kiloniella majae]|uniref:DegT/DnrJ/EryC1/StrS family aminotransferase n=1 Tax=Kiloniella majae TaxID=1938558 RepID=UPI000A278670|nr:DegT/DnrJ/EryC1/StrS family aminotransferase [Kiloniella majae]